MARKSELVLVLVTLTGAFCGLVLADASAVEGDSGQAQAVIEDVIGHGDEADCLLCHENQPEETSDEAVELVAPVSELCSTCHAEYASLKGWAHGPVATGDCLLCHDPHRSDLDSLLTAPTPALCYECHTPDILRLVGGHSDEAYARCDTCHETHSAGNRWLLKESFLSTTTGTGYREQEAHLRPQYVLVDRQDSLAGLRGVRIVTTVERQDLFARYGLNPELLKAEVERCLDQRAVRILPDEEESSGQPELHACLSLVELPFPGYPDQIGALSGSLSITLCQTVELMAPPGEARRRLCPATTWDTSAVVVWGVPQVREGLRDATEFVIGEFCADYQKANPAEEQQ